MMNDPHVVALEYRIEYRPECVDWSGANPLDMRDDRFHLRAEDGRVRFELKAHYATEEAARASVEADYISNWEFEVGLTRGRGAFRLRFDHCELVDRDPAPGPPALGIQASSGVPTVRAELAPPRPPEFPKPPHVAIRRSPDVDSMYHRFLGYLEGREPLSGMAYFCSTVFQCMGKGHGGATKRLGVSRKVLKCIRKLSSHKGGASARKEDGRDKPYTLGEERFLESAIKILIRRAAEVEKGPDPSRTKITRADIRRNSFAENGPSDQT